MVQSLTMHQIMRMFSPKTRPMGEHLHCAHAMCYFYGGLPGMGWLLRPPKLPP